MRRRVKGWPGSFSLTSSLPTNMVRTSLSGSSRCLVNQCTRQADILVLELYLPCFTGIKLLFFSSFLSDENYYEEDDEEDPDALKDPIYQIDLQVMPH